MAVWMMRGGARGEFEQKFIQQSRVYVTWDELDIDLQRLRDRKELTDEFVKRWPDSKAKQILNWVSQVWPFAHEMQKTDLVVLPLKTQRAIHIGEITGDYRFEEKGPNPFYHWRAVKWIGEYVPRDHFGKDLLYSFGAFLTICRVQRNNAEARIIAMRENGWKSESLRALAPAASASTSSSEAAETDLEESARDQIARAIMAKFKGHGLTRLVEGLLRAQGYTTYRSAEGADGGADILAGAGPLGFGSPRLCVEVKSEDSPIDRPTVDKLLGAISKFAADEGLFVSWSGFKPNVQKELASSFFKARLWGQKELLEALFTHYERLDDDLRAELPLKRIWTVAAESDE